jgi:copper chaperone CopZ
MAFSVSAYAQETKKELTKSLYMVTGLHCPPCSTTVEGSLKKLKGVQSIRVSFKDKSANIDFDESAISAQEVAKALSATPHMMGPRMQYGGALVLGVEGVKDKATAAKATAALSKVEGVANVNVFPDQEAVGIEFNGKGKTTSKQLLDALEKAGLKGASYRVGSAADANSQARNGLNGSMPIMPPWEWTTATWQPTA